MYCPDREAQLQAAVATGFDDKASFEDNFLKVTGHQQLITLFYALHRCTDHISIVIKKVEVLQEADGQAHAAVRESLPSAASSQPAYQLCVTGRHVFYLPNSIRSPLTRFLVPEAIVAWATDVLTVRCSDSKVVYWQQRVHNLPVLPWFLQWTLGFSFSMLAVYCLGW